MKKLIILLCTVLLCTLIGCSKGGETTPTVASQPEEAAQTLTLEELHQLFAETFDTVGNIQSQEEAQIAAELSALREAADTNTLPDDYETLYKNWRTEKLSAYEAEVAQLKEDYNAAISQDTALIAAWEKGKNVYADYVDFDGDGIPELLTISLDLENEEGTVSVYGKGQYGVLEFEKVHFYINTAYGENWVRLFKNDTSPLTYLGIYVNQGASMSGGSYTYYSLDGGQWNKVDAFERLRYESVDANGYFIGYEWNWTIYPEGSGEFGERITDAQYESMVSSKYTDYQELMSTSGSKLTMEHGILPDLLTVKVTVDGNPVDLVVDPFVKNGAFMVPVRPVLEAMGIPVIDVRMEFSPYRHVPLEDSFGDPDLVVASTKKQTLRIYKMARLDENLAATYYPEKYYVPYGEEIFGVQSADIPFPCIVDGQMTAPVSNIINFFGGKVSWDPVSRTLAVTGAIPEAERMSETELKAMIAFSLDDAAATIRAQGYKPVYSDWGRTVYWNGKKSWKFPVLPNGVELEFRDEWGIETNATWVTVANDGTVTWGDAYQEEMG